MAENRTELAENLKKLGSAEPVEPAFSNSAYVPKHKWYVKSHTKWHMSILNQKLNVLYVYKYPNNCVLEENNKTVSIFKKKLVYKKIIALVLVRNLEHAVKSSAITNCNSTPSTKIIYIKQKTDFKWVQ